MQEDTSPLYQTRIGEIQNNSEPFQWRHIAGELNVADDSSGGIKVTELENRSKRGPAFLQSSEDEWPQEVAALDEELAQVSMERRKAEIVFNLTLSKAEEEINVKKFSSWRRLIRVTARIKRLARKEREGRRDEVRDVSMDDPLKPQELHEAELFWIKEA